MTLDLSGSLHPSLDGAAMAMNLGYELHVFHVTNGLSCKWAIHFLEGNLICTSLHINIGNNLSQVNHSHSFVLCLAYFLLTKTVGKN